MKAKTKLHKLLSLLLTLVMLVGLLPTTAFADYETGMECPDCGHYHWDTYMCFCGYCSEECTNATCWAENHCVRCGTCHEVTAYCADCGWCQECMEEEGHCLDCYKCVENDDDLCQTCGKCEDCVGWLCMDCGQCDECTDDGEFHCEECGGCYETNGHNHGTHCADCCEFCEQCGECIILNETETCFECGLCVECCEENRDASDCSCGEYCVASVEFEEHFCEFCGNCFDDVDQCDLCYLCADCCADNSDCSDGMCVEDSDYEEHFCEDCGSCFHDADQCETCANEAGELRCVFCCESLASSYGCGCDETVCVNDPDFEEHLDTVHSEDGEIGEHAASPQTVWSMDGTDHWHGCRLCNEDDHITDKANHTYDKYGVCTVCGFKQGAPVFITHQPKDVYAKVSDVNAAESDPLYWQNNTVSFKVAAYGQELTYQWYRVAGSGTPVALDPSNQNSYSYGLGANTEKVTVPVPGDACTTVYTYYCVVTDEDGNTAESIHARIKAGHVYSRCQNVATGSEKTIYIQSGETYETKKYQDSEGHFWSCCGEEDFGDGVTDFGNTRTKTPVSHSYGNQELIWATIYSDYAQAGKFSTYYRYTCSDCGHQIYVEKHTHNFVCPVPDTEENIKYLEEHCTALTHPLVCTVGGCTETRTEQHRWQWDIVKYPEGSGAGGMMRECLDCGYWENKGWTNQSGDPVQWTTANMLVTAVHGTVNRSLAAPGDKLNLTPEQTDGKKCTGWTASYTYYINNRAVEKSVTISYTNNGNGTWSCTIPTFAAMGVKGGGQLVFTAQFADCTHSRGTRIEGARNVVCTRNGYTGDKVCVDCGKILAVGDPIPGGKEHTGTLTLIEGTAVPGDCTHRGYEGDFKCSACGGIVAGERTGYVHGDDPNIKNYMAPTCTTEGYSGDKYCNLCDKLLAHGKTLPISHGDIHTRNFKSPTCTASGYSGDKYCVKCGETVEWGKTLPPRGHNWNTGTVTKQPTATERGERLLTCLTCSEKKIEYIPRLSESDLDVLISEVSASAQRPITGETPAEAVSSQPEQYTVIKTVWRDSPSVFDPDTVYWVRITLKANDGYRFPAVGESFQGYVNGNTATIGDRSTDQVTIEYTFPKTMPADHLHEFVKEMTDPEALAREADCTNNALYYCSCECGKIGTAETAETFEGEDSALGHAWSEVWSYDTDEHWKVCTRCGEIDTENKAGHTYNSDNKCTICDYQDHEHSSEDWTVDADNHWKVCDECSQIMKDTKAPHDYTSDLDTVCDTCGYERTVDPSDHTHQWSEEWNGNDTTHWHDCISDCPITANYQKSGFGIHIYSDDEDPDCNICGRVRTIAPGIYMVTVKGSRASVTGAGDYVEGETVHISAGSRSGYTFAGWTSSDVSITDADSENASFVMPDQAVTVTANWTYNGSSGGGSGVSTYAITVDSAKNGDVTSSHKSAAKGTTITLTVEPDKGYTLETLTVTDKNGDEIRVKEKNGKYTFTMPASKVYVEATFMEDNSMLNFFVDVPADAYYYDAVLWAAENGITGGVDDTHFAPNATCTRAQAVTFLWRAAGSPAPKSSEMPFEDVAAGSYYYDAVLWAVENGVTKGTSDTTFSPDATCSRGQIVTFLWRSQKSPASDSVNPFADVAADAYYAEAVLWAVKEDITNGTSSTTFSPDADCTRAQIVTFLWRALTE